MKLTEKMGMFLLLLFSAVLLLANLGVTTFWERSEPTYAEIAREIIVTGDWLTLHYDLTNWYVHPPLYFWLTAVIGAIFGFNEFTTRFIPAVFGVLGIYITYIFGKKLYNHQVGLTAGIILALTLEYFFLSKIVLMDTILNFFTISSLYAFYVAYSDKKPNYLYLFYASMAFAILAKGPVGIVLPLLLIFLFLGLRKDWRYILDLFHFRAIALFLVIVLPWYVYEIAVNGFEFIKINFLSYTLGRYFGVVEEQAGPFYFYIPVLLIGFFPWVAYLISILMTLFKDRANSSSLFLLSSSIFIFVFFSLAGTKLPNYVISLYPLLAIGLGYFFVKALSEPDNKGLRSHFLYSNIALFIITFILIGAGWYFSGYIGVPYNHSIPMLIPLAIILGAGILTAFVLLLIKKQYFPVMLTQGLTVLAIMSYLMFYALPTVDKEYKPFKSFVQTVSQTYQSGEKVIVYKYYVYSMVFYTGTILGDRILYTESQDKINELILSKDRVYIMVFDKDFLDLKNSSIGSNIYLIDAQRPFVLISNRPTEGKK